MNQIEFDNFGIKQLRPGRPTGIDLFAGCGGFSLGLAMGGVEVVGAVELWEDACKTLRMNRSVYWPNMTILQRDIRYLTGKELLKRCGVKSLDVLYGGPPCQGFSTANQMTRGLDDPRSKLMAEFVRMVREIKPKIFMIENVPGLFEFKDFFIMLMTELEKCGYVVRFNMLNAVGYGVPQNRIRIFIHGDRLDLNKIPNWPIYTHFSEPRHKNNRIKKLWPPASAVMHELFPVNGFSKEQVKRVKYNRTLGILMDMETIADDMDQAVNRIMFKSIKLNIDKSTKKWKASMKNVRG